jgi:hydroxyacylglutathione hydrolase
MFIKCITVGPIRTNCYIVCDKVTGKAAIIDPGDEAERIISALNETECKAEYVVFTHWHADHVTAAHEVLEKTGAKLAVYEDELPYLNSMSDMGFDIKPFSPDLLLHDGDKFTFGNIELTVMHTPGHTHGSCCLLGQDTIFSGDTLFREGYGRMDLPGGDPQEMSASLKKLFALEGDYKVLPGHGSFTTLEYEKRNNPFVWSGI